MRESGEKRSDSIEFALMTTRCEPESSFCSTTVSRSAPAGAVMNATHWPSRAIVGARPMPSRCGSLPLSLAT